jgi:hypothetical protein
MVLHIHTCRLVASRASEILNNFLTTIKITTKEHLDSIMHEGMRSHEEMHFAATEISETCPSKYIKLNTSEKRKIG